MAQKQLTIDFNANILDGKRTHRISITSSEEFKTLLETISRLKRTDVSKLGFQYLVEGVQRDIGEMFIMEPHLDSPLRGILSKKF